MTLRLPIVASIAALGSVGLTLAMHAPVAHAQSASVGARCESAGLSLPPGFCATVFADNVGHARHMAVASDGTVYVNTWSGRYYQNGTPPPPGGFLVALRDADGDGRAEMVQRFGPTQADGNAGGTGIALFEGALFAETNDKIVRYPLAAGHVVPDGEPTTILSGMPLTGDHPMHPFTIDEQGHLFVNSGSPSNVCEKQNRQPGSTGKVPCEELATRAGIWRYDTGRTGQVFSPAERFATGIRNTGGIAFDPTGRMFAMQHGRDQLSQNWPALYRPDQGPVLPAEELIAPAEGADFGWPSCYYDGVQRKLVLAPEYGGDGGHAVGACGNKRPPVAAFPAHWAPNDLLIYAGAQFPAAYRGGVFIAFHGSWNRAPAPQDGYKVVFQPMADGKPSGPYILFADGFAGRVKEPGEAAARPAGLAMAPDGALYIADDVHGRIWRVTYQAAAGAALIAASPAPSGDRAVAAAPPEGVHADAGRAERALAPPPGFTAEQVALGNRIYHGEERDGTCSGCHGSNLRGTSVGPSLTGPEWLWADGSVRSIAQIVRAGVPHPKRFGGAMPPKGGAPLSEDDVEAIAAYVWAAGQHASSARLGLAGT